MDFYMFYVILTVGGKIKISSGCSLMIEFISWLMEVLEYLFRSLCGFRYIFSSKYRRVTHEHWWKNKIEAVGEIFVLLLGMSLIGVVGGE